ncbi:hypothetical protein Moror_1150 [Moniliophthora roreri MCA 2997]|uniref:Uncharacterized protein n=2 Tax=Moniliophthora roreri TaxID=221103 RepID=V2XBU5_MONRO|nr:hypothetical protein Moror_1150 [Moniliophthora roreri MCA 2997]KAI3599198.1 hypothetical protein WG66_013428 [Moniliophthora roreri]
MTDDGPQSSEDGSGLHSPIYDAPYPSPHVREFRYQGRVDIQNSTQSMYGANMAVESATLLAESAESSNTSILPLFLAFVVFAALGKFLHPYISLSALEKAINDTRHEMVTEIVYRRLPSEDKLRVALESLDTATANLRNELYSSDDMSWIRYARFFLWTRWKVPLMLNWKLAKIRRRMLGLGLSCGLRTGSSSWLEQLSHG